MIHIHPETSTDAPGIRSVNERAFGRSAEADLVDRLRATCPRFISLVAVEDRQVIGHILFTPVTLDEHPALAGMGLGPLAVLPEQQRQGIGSALIRSGISVLLEQGCPYISVLGHASYYPRFGFVPASRFGIRPQWAGVPDDAFMIMPLRPEAVPPAGVLRYHPAFDGV